MRPQILHDYIIFPTLARMGEKYNSQAARQLLLATSGQESRCGDYFKQLGAGPALGIYQMEPPTVDDLYVNYLAPQKLEPLVLQFASQAGQESPELVSLLGETFYATALARMNYWRRKEAHPKFNDFNGMWAYYKKYWNSHLGAATEAEFKANWNKFVVGVDFSDPTPRVQRFTKAL